MTRFMHVSTWQEYHKDDCYIMFSGRQEDGTTVCFAIPDFKTYAYIPVPATLYDTWFNAIDRFLRNEFAGRRRARVPPTMIDRVEPVRKTDFYGYNTEQDYMRIVLDRPEYQGWLKKGVMDGTLEYAGIARDIFEADFPYTLRILIDNGWKSSAWFEVDMAHAKELQNVCRCQETYRVSHKAIRMSDDQAGLAPLNILSFDIEVAGDPGEMPSSDTHPIIMIGSVVKHVNQSDKDPPLQYVVHTWRGADPEMPCDFNGVCPTVVVSDSEQSMLEDWEDFVHEADADILTGYNIVQFDLPFIIDRANQCNLSLSLSKETRVTGRDTIEIPGRSIIDMLTVVKGSFKLRSYKLDAVAQHFLNEARVIKFSVDRTDITGILVSGSEPGNTYAMRVGDKTYNGKEMERLNFPAPLPKNETFMLVFANNVKQPQVLVELFVSSKLVMEDFAIAFHHSDEHKTGIHYTQITPLWNSDAAGRGRLIRYVGADACLPMRVMWKLTVVPDMIQMSRVCIMDMQTLNTRGETLKCVVLLYEECFRTGYIVPTRTVDRDAASAGDKYKGATVITPRTGYYEKDTVSTLDFKSLYPSIMRSFNICPSSLVAPERVGDFPSDDLFKSPAGHAFVKHHLRESVTGNILGRLLDERGRVKKRMADEKDPFRKMLLNGLQLALKLRSNAMYGFYGAHTNALACIPVSESITSYGRQGLQLTEQEVRANYPGALIVYGDTDSVFVRFAKGLSVAKSMELGEEACRIVNERFRRENSRTCIQLEFEKVFAYLLLIAKKRYAGLLFTKPHAPDFVHCSGIESVRRDNCLLCSTVMDAVLHMLLYRRNLELALDIVRLVLQRMYMHQIPIDRFVISKELTKADYKNKQPHVELVKRMRRRQTNGIPQIGQRVAYVIVAGSPGQKMCELAEDPDYVLANGMYPDVKYYIEKQIKGPLRRILEPVIGPHKFQELFTGKHTRKRANTTPKNSQILRMFASQANKRARAAETTDNAVAASSCAPSGTDSVSGGRE